MSPYLKALFAVLTTEEVKEQKRGYSIRIRSPGNHVYNKIYNEIVWKVQQPSPSIRMQGLIKSGWK